MSYECYRNPVLKYGFCDFFAQQYAIYHRCRRIKTKLNLIWNGNEYLRGNLFIIDESFLHLMCYVWRVESSLPGIGFLSLEQTRQIRSVLFPKAHFKHHHLASGPLIVTTIM